MQRQADVSGKIIAPLFPSFRPLFRGVYGHRRHDDVLTPTRVRPGRHTFEKAGSCSLRQRRFFIITRASYHFTPPLFYAACRHMPHLAMPAFLARAMPLIHMPFALGHYASGRHYSLTRPHGLYSRRRPRHIRALLLSTSLFMRTYCAY